MKKRGVWINLSGCDASGKSTFIQFLKDALDELLPLHLEDNDNEFTSVISWAGNKEMGQQLRAHLHKGDVDKRVNPFMFLAAKAEAYTCVKKHLDNDGIVITDRFIPCTYAYGTVANKEKFSDEIFKSILLQQGTESLQPDDIFARATDIEIHIKIDPNIAVARMNARIETQSVLDVKSAAYLHSVEKGYAEYFAKYDKTARNYFIYSMNKKNVFIDEYRQVANNPSNRMYIEFVNRGTLNDLKLIAKQIAEDIVRYHIEKTEDYKHTFEISDDDVEAHYARSASNFLSQDECNALLRGVDRAKVGEPLYEVYEKLDKIMHEYRYKLYEVFKEVGDKYAEKL